MGFDKSFLCASIIAQLVLVTVCQQNPVFPGWYADPEAIIYGNTYWIYPTYSSTEQLHFDAFSSPDLVTWTRHWRIITNSEVTWARYSMWAPSVFSHLGKYYFLFSANAINSEDELGGIGVAISDFPQGPYRDLLGRPLINAIANGAQPIDQFVFKDVDDTFYMFYGLESLQFGYVEGPFMFRRNGTYYFMWSEGGWGGPDYRVAYAKSSSVFGPFVRERTILEQDPNIATGAGHHSVINPPGTDDWYIVYHRRPLSETDANHRVTCIDRMFFDDQGNILPVQMTNEGVTGPILP
ncbi:arabinoxylan arabinofuranohydrolase [Folsomia candida]|uniref:arabinoxylan arabinofuranohydrolase n=1 Tax=Folsomia candida TaxID=158441 RepID=UPI000B8F33CD|nr:arabinoxylan arabinofuranohydrolase [Folsomia candida]